MKIKIPLQDALKVENLRISSAIQKYNFVLLGFSEANFRKKYKEEVQKSTKCITNYNSANIGK